MGVVIADDSLVANKDKLDEKKAEMAIPPADGSLVFNGPQVCLINKNVFDDDKLNFQLYSTTGNSYFFLE